MVESIYTFPRWSFNIAVVAFIRMIHGNPTAGLTLQRRISSSSCARADSIIHLSRYGSASEVRGILEKYPDSIRYVSASQGSTPLREALYRRRYENVNVLLAAGADPFAIDDYGRADCIVLIVETLAKHHGSSIQQHLLPPMTSFDDYNISHLTKVILGFRPLDLQTELNKLSSLRVVNDKDKTGQTPMHWAVRIGDSSAVRLLLEAGADIEIRDAGYTTPLHRACRYLKSASCVEELVQAGAKLDCRDSGGCLPIHCAAKAGQSEKILSLLITNESNINDPDARCKGTPLAYAAQAKRDNPCRYLLAHGAQIDPEDWEGDTPLFEAIRTRAHHNCRGLLSAGANYLHSNHLGHTILHRLARVGDEGIADAISECRLKGLDPNAEDRQGRTARDYFQMREGTPDGLVSAFDRLVQRIDSVNAIEKEAFESDSEDEFFDALESIEI